MSRGDASPWVRRFAPLIRPGGHVLDLAAGGGRHTAFLLEFGYRVTAADRHVDGLRDLESEHCRVLPLDLEAAPPDAVFGVVGTGYDGVVVTHYLHRPLFPALVQALGPEGVLIYETFSAGNERFGHPRNPGFLLAPGELLSAFAGVTVIAFEQGEIGNPAVAVKQRIAATRGALGRLPE